MTRTPRASRLIALALVASLALPTLAVTAGCGSKNTDNGQVSTTAPTDTTNAQPNAQPAKAGLTVKQKVVLLAGAALLYYMYTRYKKQDAQAAQNGGAGAHPQLYREDKGPNKGAIYYRKNDANHTVVWLQAPQGGVQVPTDQAQQALGNGFDPNNPNAYQPPEQINPNPQSGVNGGGVESADQYAGASQ
jgi:hypothetical protein